MSLAVLEVAGPERVDCVLSSDSCSLELDLVLPCSSGLLPAPVDEQAESADERASHDQGMSPRDLLLAAAPVCLGLRTHAPSIAARGQS